MAKGFSHVGLATLDLDQTREFYEGVLGFNPVRCDIINVTEGGRIRHIFFDAGRDQLIAFMQARGEPGAPAEYDAGINRGLGVPAAFYHFAFEAGNEPALLQKREELIGRSFKVTEIIDYDWPSRSSSVIQRDVARVPLLLGASSAGMMR
jgi:catechol 2,3-dioxygenase-like lactoylglutathione lyase family enzyme